MTPAVIFVAATAVLLFISRKCLLRPRCHGFYRFFAWESILALVLLNMPAWYTNPFVPRLIPSWILFLTSTSLMLHGFYLLLVIGKPSPHADVALLPFERTVVLVTVGAYKYIRHPLFASLLALAWGIFLMLPSWNGLLLAFSTTFWLLRTAKAEEAECRQYFGPAYDTYMQTAKRFIPFLF